MADKHAIVKTLILTVSMKFSIQASIQTFLTPFRKIKQAGNSSVFEESEIKEIHDRPTYIHYQSLHFPHESNKKSKCLY